MEQQPYKSSQTPVIFLFLAALLAMVCIWTSRLNIFRTSWSFVAVGMDLRWMFWLPAALSAACLLPPVYAVLQALHHRGALPAVLDGPFQEPFQNTVRTTLTRAKTVLHSFGGQISVVAISIVLIIALLTKTYLIRDREATTFLDESVSSLLTKSGQQPAVPSVLQLGLFTASSDVSDYLQYCLRIVKDLKEAGVKAVLVDVRDAAYIKNNPTSKLIDELAKSEVVVLGINNYWEFRTTTYARGVYTYMPQESRVSRVVHRVQPAADALKYQGTPLDVSLELLRKYRGYAPDLSPRRDGSAVVFGDYRFPVTSDGSLYTRGLDDWKYINSGVSAQIGFTSDTLKYWFRRTEATNLAGFRNQLSNKMIIILWYSHSTIKSMDDYFTLLANAATLDNITKGNYLRKVELNPVWLVGLCVAISCFVAYRLRPLASVLSIFLFGLLYIIINSLLYDRLNILVDMAYPLLSILMAMLIFPALSFVHTLGKS